MKLKSLNIYSFHVRAKTDWLILELISTEDIKGYSEITMSNYCLLYTSDAADD